MLQRLADPQAFPTAATAAGSGAVNFYGLLHIDRQRNKDANLKWSRDPVAVYVGCASLLAASARACGMSFGLFTNAPDEVQRIVRAQDLPPFAVSGLEFSRTVPRVKDFYSAHFKIDVMREIASGRYGDCVGLIDVDTVFLDAMPDDLARSAVGAIVAYDVSTGSNPLHFDDHIHRDLELVADMKIDNPVWYGGEYLVADIGRLAALVDEVELVWPRYVSNIDKVHHVGDEMPVSAALNRMAIAGERILDAGRAGLAKRWWSLRTKYPQPAFAELERQALFLHLPGDKRFLASQARLGFERRRFLEAFKRYRRPRRAWRRLYEFLDVYLSAEVDISR